MTTMTMEQKNLYDAVCSLPKEMCGIALDFVEYLRADEDDEPLTDSELEQIAASHEDIAAGRVYSLEEVEEYLKNLK